MGTVIPLEARRRLNVGSGRRYDPEAINVDVTPDTGPDVVHDLNRFPWPFPDSRFDEVEIRDVLEHLDNTVRVLEELHRVSRPGAWIDIVVPHFSSNGAFTDPTHRRFFALATFDYFMEGHPNNFYTQVRFTRTEARIFFRPSLLNKLVWRLANWFPTAYEERWAWMFPAWFIGIRLRVEKKPS